jgi:HEAT repeat protein
MMFDAARTLVLLGACFIPQDAPREHARSLVEKLHSDSVEDRENAVSKLKELGDVAIPELEKAARSSDLEVSSRATYLLVWNEVRKKGSPDLRKVIPDLEDRLAQGRWTEVFLEAWDKQHNVNGVHFNKRVVEFMGVPAARGAKTKEERVNVSKAVGLWEIRAASPELLQFLKDPDPEVRATSAEALGRLHYQEAKAPLLLLLQDPAPSVRGMAARGLAVLKAKDAISGITALLKDGDHVVRLNALGSLKYLDAVEASPAIADLIADDNSTVRRWAIEALGDLGYSKAIPQIVDRLKDTDLDVRLTALKILADLGAKTSAPSIRGQLAAEKLSERLVAIHSLGRLADRGAMAEIAKQLGADQAFVRAAAAESLGRMSAKSETTGIQRLLQDQVAYVRGIAILALGDMHDRGSIPLLEKLLGDGDKFDLVAAFRGSAATATDDGFRILDGLLWEPDVQDLELTIRSIAAATLCRLGSPNGVEVLIQEAEKEHGFGVRLTNLNALRNPEMWETLEHKIQGQAVRGRIREILDPICHEAGIKLEIVPGSLEKIERNRSTVGPTWNWPAGTPLLSMLETMLRERGSAIILESGSLRVIGGDDSVDYWKNWWEKDGKKK